MMKEIFKISLKRNNYFLNKINNSFVLIVNKKIYNDTQKNYGKICQINDKIGVFYLLMIIIL